MTTKCCFKCLCEKPIETFYKHAMMKDGYLNKCKECTKSEAVKNRLNKIEKYRAYDKMRAAMPHRVAQTKRVVREWRIAHPERKAANTALGYAVRTGKVQKQPCWVCGLKAVAHHPDYSRPLEVVWLCQPHHKQAHALI